MPLDLNLCYVVFFKPACPIPTKLLISDFEYLVLKDSPSRMKDLRTTNNVLELLKRY